MPLASRLLGWVSGIPFRKGATPIRTFPVKGEGAWPPPKCERVGGAAANTRRVRAGSAPARFSLYAG